MSTKKNTLKELIRAVENIVPFKYALSGDCAGLLVGLNNLNVERVLLTVECLESVVDEAIAKKAQAIISYNAPKIADFPSPTSKSTSGELIHKIIRNEIAWIAVNSAFEVMPGGINDILLKILNCTKIRPLEIIDKEYLSKVEIDVSEEFLPNVIAAALKTSNRDEDFEYIIRSGSVLLKNRNGGSSFEVNSKYAEELRKIETNNLRLEIICEHNLATKLITNIEYFSKENIGSVNIVKLLMPDKQAGLGRVGELPEKLDIGKLITEIKRVLNINNIRFVKGEQHKIKRIAVYAGENLNENLIKKVVNYGAQCLIAAESNQRNLMIIASQGLSFIEVDGFSLKKFGLNNIKEKLSKIAVDTEIMVSDANTNFLNWA